MARIGIMFFVIGLLSRLPAVAFGNPADLLAGAADATDPEIHAAIAVASVVVDADGRASVDVAFTVGNASVVGLQFDIRSDTRVELLSAGGGVAADRSGKKIWTANIEPSLTRFLVIGFNHTAIPEGAIATLLVRVKPGTVAGYYPLTVSNVVGVTDTGSEVLPSASDGGIAVPGAGLFAPAVQGVMNGASFVSGAISPGEIVVIRGISLAESAAGLQLTSEGLIAASLGLTRVLFDGMPAPLLHVSPEEILAVVPYALDQQPRTVLQVEFRGIRSVPLGLPVSESAPGIFTQNGSGVGAGAILNEDSSVNGPDHPASPGSIVTIYATGEGQTFPAGVDGRIIAAGELSRPLLPVSASIDGRSVEVLYAGSGVGQVAGLFQINLRVPSGLVPGNALPVTVSVGGSSSQAGVTIAVQ